MLAIWLGVLAGRRSGRTWIGWAAGLAAYGAGTWFLLFALDLPGVGWRLDALLNSGDY